MSFADFMSVLSVYRIQQPDAIWFHCNRLPNNSDFYWGQLWKSVPLTVIYHDEQTGKHDFETGLKSVQDSAVVTTLLQHGGIYVDWNILVVRSLNPLRNYSTCVSKVGLLLTFIVILSVNQFICGNPHIMLQLTCYFQVNTVYIMTVINYVRSQIAQNITIVSV